MTTHQPWQVYVCYLDLYVIYNNSVNNFECVTSSNEMIVCNFPPWQPRFCPASGYMKVMMDKVAQVGSVRVLGFVCQFSFH
jgi:hypothetical protein